MREIKLIKEALRKFNLNLDGFVVFTEAASGHYKWTSIIAALAGAEKVYAVARDSKYGKQKVIKREIDSIAKRLKVCRNITVVFSKDSVGEADIITNLGFVRPIKKTLIRRMKPTAVISLMCEPWECRSSDIDLEACFREGIVVAGTNEQDRRIRIFDYLGFLVEKKIYEADHEFFKNNVAIFGKDVFGEKIFSVLRKQNRKVFIYDLNEIEYFLSKVASFDVIILARHSCNNKILFNREILEKIKSINPDIFFIQIAGGLINCKAAKKMDFRVFPETKVRAGSMGYTLSELGPKPVIDLHTAGLKVGEIMARKRKRMNWNKSDIGRLVKRI